MKGTALKLSESQIVAGTLTVKMLAGNNVSVARAHSAVPIALPQSVKIVYRNFTDYATRSFSATV